MVESIDAVLRRLGGTARRWRMDRMTTVLVPGTVAIRSSFVGVAQHYGLGIDACPPRRPNQKVMVTRFCGVSSLGLVVRRLGCCSGFSRIRSGFAS